MFDIGFWELAVIAMIALLIMGPERIPEFAIEAGKWISRIRNILRSFQKELEKEMRLGETGNLNDRIDNLERLLEDAPDKKSEDPSREN